MKRSPSPAGHRAFLLLLVALALVLCRRREAVFATRDLPDLYTSETISAVVIDEETQRPIPDAAVVAIWRTVDIVSEAWGPTAFRLVETTTDGEGRFAIPRWGPRYLDRAHYYLDGRDPEIWILKRGYLVGYHDNTGRRPARGFTGMRISKAAPGRLPNSRYREFARTSAHGGSVWNGKTLYLDRARSAQEEARSLLLAAPLDKYEAVTRNDVPLFWKEWLAAREALGPEWVQRIEQPLPLMHRGGTFQKGGLHRPGFCS